MVSPSPRDEARINDALKKLCEEFHLGMVQADEYRARRRRLLEGWADRDTTTAPGMSRARTAQAQAQKQAQAAAAPAPAKPTAAAAGSSKTLVITIAILVAVALAAYALLSMRRAAPPGPASPGGTAAVVNSEHLAQIRQAAIDFVARNQWEAPDLDGFLGRWRQLSPAEQGLARQEPSLRSLRYELQQNIQAATQIAVGNTDAAVRQRRDHLLAFAQVLEGVAQ